MARRAYVENVDLPRDASWDEWEAVVQFALSRTGPPRAQHHWASWAGGQVSADNFEEMRDHAEGQDGLSYVQIRILGHQLSFLIDPLDHVSRVSVESEDEDLALGAAEALRRRVSEGLRPAPRQSGEDQPDGLGADPPPAWQRVLQTPNPWVLIVAGTVVAGLILAWAVGSG